MFSTGMLDPKALWTAVAGLIEKGFEDATQGPKTILLLEFNIRNVNHVPGIGINRWVGAGPITVVIRVHQSSVDVEIEYPVLLSSPADSGLTRGGPP